MRIHICDTSDLPIHGCCGGFIWPATMIVCCGKVLPFKMITVDSLLGDERICQKCLEVYKARSEESQRSICTIVE